MQLKLKISSQLNVLIILFLVFMMLLILNTYMRDYRILDFYVRNSIKLNMEQTEQNVSTFISQIKDILFTLQYSSTVLEYLTQDDPLKHYELHDWMKNTVTNYNHLRKDIYDIGFITKEKTIYFKNDSGYLFRELRNGGILDNHQTFTCGVINELSNAIGIGNWYIYFSSPIYEMNYKVPLEKVAEVVVIVESHNINKYIRSFKISSDTKIYLVNNDNLVIASTETEELYNEFKHDDLYGLKDKKVEIDGSEYIVYSSVIEGWNLVTIIPFNDIYGTILHTKTVNIFFASIGFAVILALSLTIKYSISSPINRIIRDLKRIQKGELDFRLSEIKNNEIGVVTESINKMLDEVQILTNNIIKNRDKLYKAEIEKKQTELMFLHSQINPHFLYNTLEGISSIAAYYDVYEIEQIATSLGLLLRFSIKGSNSITISQELMVLDNYITIQKVRFEDKFDIHFDIDPDVLSCSIPKLTLQPLLENSIVHGISQRIRKGNIWLSIKGIGSNILINVEDDGVGISREVLKEIQNFFDQGEKNGLLSTSEKNGIGIINVYMKLKLAFEKISFEIDSRLNEYTRVKIIIPKK